MKVHSGRRDMQIYVQLLEMKAQLERRAGMDPQGGSEWELYGSVSEVPTDLSLSGQR